MTRLTIEQFGEVLLKTGDLDPMYLAVNAAKLPTEQLHRLMLSYFCFYHLGAAARMAEARTASHFWEMMRMAAAYSPVHMPKAMAWPRGAERRHYRGMQAMKSMAELEGAYNSPKTSVTAAIQHFIGASGRDALTFKSVSKAVQEHRGFGEWIAFKVADVAERVLGYNVDFTDCELGIYKDPRQGAAVAYLGKEPAKGRDFDGAAWDWPITDDQLKTITDYYVWYFSHLVRRPKYMTRNVNVQEVETIFCKYKSHLKGHYPVGKDTVEIGHGLDGWGDLAQQLKRGLPDKVWTQEVMKVTE